MFTGKARMQFKPSPLKSTFAPSFLTLSLTQWIRPLYLCWSDSSICMRDLMTSMGVANPQARTPAKPPESSTTRKPAGDSEGRRAAHLCLVQLQPSRIWQHTLVTCMFFRSYFVQLSQLCVSSDLREFLHMWHFEHHVKWMWYSLKALTPSSDGSNFYNS